ncbi:hypothetical protein LIER_18349 [Lithospermum erythrorhizon]|uniref:Retrovirus-related Pol polyprotein from transposon TNT 1-94-like beta-barrel domain-containing protein n=1 Tax=Lithospermum erythrorhizon TaxID=34254 RepID=A0AAV3QJ56_LITER
MAEDKTLTIVPHFVGHYDHWSEMMENLLRARGLWNVVERIHVEPLNTEVSTSKIIWESLKKKYGGNAKIKKSMLNALRREFELLEMKKGETVDSYFGRVNTVSNKLRSNGDNIKTQKEEEPEDEQVLKVEQTSYDRGRGRFSSRGRGRGGRGGRGAFNKATVECYKCHGLGHFQYECSKWNKETNFAEIDENEEEVLLMAYTEGVQANGKKRTWFIDSGCSNHMCNDAEMFTTMDSSFNNYVKLGNNRKMAVSGK